MKSIRRHILFASGLTSAVLLTGLGVFIYFLVSHSLDRQFRMVLTSRLGAVVAAMDVGHQGRINLDSPDDAFGNGRAAAFPRYVEVWNAQGQPVFKSREMAQYSLTFVRPIGGQISFHNARLHEDLHVGQALALVHLESSEHDQQHGEHHDGDVASHPILGSDQRASSKTSGKTYVVGVAHSLESLNDTKTILAGSLALGCGGAVLVSAALLVLIVSRGLAPVRLISQRIEAVGISDMSDRLTTTGVPVELSPIVQRLNELLTRVHNAFTREKQLTADIAHELRTPIAGLRTTLELADKRTRSPAEYQTCVQSCLSVTLQMQVMVENLLTLSRLEGNQFNFSGGRIRVDRLVTELLEAFSADIAARNLNIIHPNLTECWLSAPPGAVRMVIQNLLDNAISYTDDGGQVEIEVAPAAGGVWLRTANTGSRVAAQDSERVFDRFWRGDEARTQSGLHAGLGLAIVKRVLDAIGGSVRVVSEMNGWFRVEVYFKDMAGHE